ncbi:MAG TPA: phage holin family protein [Sphingomicrobium sp.]
MLKPAEPGPGGPEPQAGKPISELLNQLVEDGKAYAEAEINVAKAIAEAKADAIKLPAILLGAALLFAQAAVVVFGMTVYLTLVSRLGPFLSGMLATLLCIGIAAGLGWYALRRLKSLS